MDTEDVDGEQDVTAAAAADGDDGAVTSSDKPAAAAAAEAPAGPEAMQQQQEQVLIPYQVRNECLNPPAAAAGSMSSRQLRLHIARQAVQQLQRCTAAVPKQHLVLLLISKLKKAGGLGAAELAAAVCKTLEAMLRQDSGSSSEDEGVAGGVRLLSEVQKDSMDGSGSVFVDLPGRVAAGSSSRAGGKDDAVLHGTGADKGAAAGSSLATADPSAAAAASGEGAAAAVVDAASAAVWDCAETLLQCFEAAEAGTSSQPQQQQRVCMRVSLLRCIAGL
jgi:hypothetical protein